MKRRIAYCGWCGAKVGFEDVNGMKQVNRIIHMRQAHPIRKAIVDILYPITGRFGGIISFPIRWENM